MTQVIPVVNCRNRICVAERLAQIHALGATWAHMDVGDGKFTLATTWDNPGDLKRVLAENGGPISLEAHLMVEHPEEAIDEWLAAGVKRAVVQLETIHGSIEQLRDHVTRYGADLMLSLAPQTPADEVLQFAPSNGETFYVQVLAVDPGWAGQKFQFSVVQKVEWLHTQIPNAIIEVDGGMNLETGRAVVASGAAILTSATYIFGSRDPKAAYEALTKL